MAAVIVQKILLNQFWIKIQINPNKSAARFSKEKYFPLSVIIWKFFSIHLFQNWRRKKSKWIIIGDYFWCCKISKDQKGQEEWGPLDSKTFQNMLMIPLTFSLIPQKDFVDQFFKTKRTMQAFKRQIDIWHTCFIAVHITKSWEWESQFQ